MDKKRSLLSEDFHAWNPGLSSNLPKRLLPVISLFRPENSDIGYQQAKEAADFSGLAVEQLCSLKINRLVVHEVLIRVTADLSVPDGPSYEYLGLQIRGMVECIYSNYMVPEMDTISRGFLGVRERAEQEFVKLTNEVFSFKTVEKKSRKKLFGLLKLKAKSVPVIDDPPELKALDNLRDRLYKSDDFSRACLTAIIKVVSGIMGKQGRLVADRSLIVELALRVFCNDYGSSKIGQLIAPIFTKAALAEGYQFLPAQSKPIVMNTKGASAAGKSTIRPQQRYLAERMGVPWKDFALISPDYWRKYLLDYNSLGDDFKYAAMLTGRELEFVDKKLDRYMAQKSHEKTVPHLLIDRFRFDSFKIGSEGDYKSTLLSRFGSTVFLFFVITPPFATVDRAWKRGLTTSRYKAVDDLLYHNVEAYTGIPELFFSWTSIKDKNIYFEFLDNDVPFGKLPKTIAFGYNGAMTILDPVGLSNIDRFKEVNIGATCPEDVLNQDWTPTYQFLRQCIKVLPKVKFANQVNAQIYGRIEQGQWDYKNMTTVPQDENTVGCLTNLGWDQLPLPEALPIEEINILEVKRITLGAWGESVNVDKHD
ncbi:zeta toxin family protein [Candidatus Puniceispirillum sp.]|nr:zeta toxin family protein [Candidatus Puniceispirillum sp.]